MLQEGRWVTRYSKRGHPFQVWDTPVPRIPDKLLNSVVYLYPDEAAAEDGKKAGGSGFLCGLDLLLGGPQATFVVTNKHVVQSGSAVVRLNTTDGKLDIIALDGVEWFDHPEGDDLTVCPIALDLKVHSHSPFSLYHVTKKWADDYNVGLGDDVFMIGRFVGAEGKIQNNPSVRFGVISQMPFEPLVLEDGSSQLSYLIEARSIPGYSGSPVFIIIEPHGPKPSFLPSDMPPAIHDALIEMSGWMKERAGKLRMPPFLLGIDYCHLYDKQKVWSGLTKKPVDPNWFVKGNSGAMGVIPAWKLSEMFEKHPKLKAHVAAVKEIARRDQNSSRAALDVAEADPLAKDENPQHQEDFTSLLGKAARTPPQDD